MLKILKIPNTVYLKSATAVVTVGFVVAARTTGVLHQQVSVIKPATIGNANTIADKNGVIVMQSTEQTKPITSPSTLVSPPSATPPNSQNKTPVVTKPKSTSLAPTTSSNQPSTSPINPTNTTPKPSSSPSPSSLVTPPTKQPSPMPMPKSSPTPSPTPTPSPAPTPAPTPTPTPTPTPAPTYTYRNGTYSTAGSYSAPSGNESIGITLVINNDDITDSTATAMGNNGTSRYYQDDFISQYKSLVVGKKLADVFLNKVSISSLTPTGFNNAATAIRASAHN